MAKGGRVSLTAFEAEWLRLHIDTTVDEALDAFPFVDVSAPKSVTSDPPAAWQRIIDKVSAAASKAEDGR